MAHYSEAAEGSRYVEADVHTDLAEGVVSAGAKLYSKRPIPENASFIGETVFDTDQDGNRVGDKRTCVENPKIFPYNCIGYMRMVFSGISCLELASGTCFACELDGTKCLLTVAHNVIDNCLPRKGALRCDIYMGRDPNDSANSNCPTFVKHSAQFKLAFGSLSEYQPLQLCDFCILPLSDKEQKLLPDNCFRLSKLGKRDSTQVYNITGYPGDEPQQPKRFNGHMWTVSFTANQLHRMPTGDQQIHYHHATSGGMSGGPLWTQPSLEREQAMVVGLHQGAIRDSANLALATTDNVVDQIRAVLKSPVSIMQSGQSFCLKSSSLTSRPSCITSRMCLANENNKIYVVELSPQSTTGVLKCFKYSNNAWGTRGSGWKTESTSIRAVAFMSHADKLLLVLNRELAVCSLSGQIEYYPLNSIEFNQVRDVTIATDKSIYIIMKYAPADVVVFDAQFQQRNRYRVLDEAERLIVLNTRRVITVVASRHAIAAYYTNGQRKWLLDRQCLKQQALCNRFARIRGLCSMPDDSFLVADEDNHCVSQFGDNGVFLRTIASSRDNLNCPVDVVFRDETNELFVLLFGGLVKVFELKLTSF